MTGLPELSETLVAVERPVLELDELWSFVLKKARKRRVWLALCRQTRQVVAFVIRRPRREDLPLAVASGSRSLPRRAVLHGLPGGVLERAAG